MSKAIAEERQHKVKGFTLLELIIVMALIGLITAVAMPNLSGTLLNLQTRSAVKNISALLRYARDQAVSKQQIQRVVFDFAKNRVRLLAEADDLRDETGQADSSSRTEIKQIYNLPGKVTFYQAKNMQGDDETKEFSFVFYPAGSSSGGEISVAGNPGQLYAIRVDFITGITEVL